MNSEKLLELATKVAGSAAKEPTWNPLANAGDALGLECELGLDVIWLPGSVRVGNSIAFACECKTEAHFHEHGGDRGMARRFAAVSAAAKIGAKFGHLHW